MSRTADPTGSWVIYHLPVQNDGTDGTPNHGCSLYPDGSGHGPCLGDYPHIEADANGFYITTNEYSLFGPEYTSANIYAFSQRALASGRPDGHGRPVRYPDGSGREPGVHRVACHLASGAISSRQRRDGVLPLVGRRGGGQRHGVEQSDFPLSGH